jgi:hypothetical protein
VRRRQISNQMHEVAGCREFVSILQNSSETACIVCLALDRSLNSKPMNVLVTELGLLPVDT